jgi:uncharacterized SAM-binding protein YcdF (DUF218 family)
MAHPRTLHRLHSVANRKKRSRQRWRLLKLLLPISLPLAPIAWMGYREVENTWIEPQAIFVLGGEEEREIFAAKFAAAHPHLPVWISGGAPPSYTKRVFAKVGIDPSNLHLDYRASDTLTNFTTTLDLFKARGITSMYLITSDDHIRRARTIGEVVFGSHGIKLKPITFTSTKDPEPLQKTFRDGIRSLVWLTTGYSGSPGNKN